MHGLRFSWRQTPVQAAIAFVLAGATLASVPAHAHGQDGAASAPAAVPAKALPGDDFYDYVNGDWMRSTQIPADRSSWGSFAMLANATNERIIGLVEGLSATQQADAGARQSLETKVRASILDTIKVKKPAAAPPAKGAKPAPRGRK